MLKAFLAEGGRANLMRFGWICTMLHGYDPASIKASAYLNDEGELKEAPVLSSNYFQSKLAC